MKTILSLSLVTLSIILNESMPLVSMFIAILGLVVMYSKEIKEVLVNVKKNFGYCN